MSIERVFVIGAGLMGHGIAQVSAVAGKSVTLSDRTGELAEKGRKRIEGNLARQVAKGKLEQAAADEILGRVATAAGADGAQGHDLVIEAVFEDEPLKRETWAALSKTADPGTIFASNTSSISITGLATATDRPERFIGLHFFSPVPVMKLIEIIRGLETDDATHDACRAFAEEVGKTVIESKDMPGFLVNRMLGPFINEAIFALMESTGTAEDIDTGAKLGLNHPMGPLELSDFIGNDVMLGVMDVLYRGFGDPKFRAAPLLRQMVAARAPGPQGGARLLPLRRAGEQGRLMAHRAPDTPGPLRPQRGGAAGPRHRPRLRRAPSWRPRWPGATRRSATTATCSGAWRSWGSPACPTPRSTAAPGWGRFDWILACEEIAAADMGMAVSLSVHVLAQLPHPLVRHRRPEAAPPPAHDRRRSDLAPSPSPSRAQVPMPPPSRCSPSGPMPATP